MTEARTAEELSFGRAAQELNPRRIAELAGSPLTQADDTVCVRYRAAALGADVRRALSELPGALMRALPTSGSTDPESGEELLCCSLAGLHELAQVCGPAALLLNAHEQAARPPARARIMGVLNVTPDSFSDGGRYATPARAIEHARQMAEQGADLIDVGGESTRPGAEPVSVEEELRRTLPVIEELAGTGPPLSIDTTKAQVARQAVEAGASMVNDVSAGTRDPEMLPSVAELGVEYVAMHMRGAPAEMQRSPAYTDPVAEIALYLRERTWSCLKAGVESHKIVLDPGIGFGKQLEHNLEILRRLAELRSLGRPLLVGVSRKSFIAHLTRSQRPDDWQGSQASDHPSQRLGGTAAALTACVLSGVDILRVHDVSVMKEAALIASALRPPTTSPPAVGHS